MEQPLDPFNNAEINKVKITFDNWRLIDVFDYKKKICYKYDDLRFDGKTPKEFGQQRESLAVDFPPYVSYAYSYSSSSSTKKN